MLGLGAKQSIFRKQKIYGILHLDNSGFVGAMDMDWKDREKSQDQDS